MIIINIIVAVQFYYFIFSFISNKSIPGVYARYIMYNQCNLKCYCNLKYSSVIMNDSKKFLIQSNVHIKWSSNSFHFILHFIISSKVKKKSRQYETVVIVDFFQFSRNELCSEYIKPIKWNKKNNFWHMHILFDVILYLGFIYSWAFTSPVKTNASGMCGWNWCRYKEHWRK